MSTKLSMEQRFLCSLLEKTLTGKHTVKLPEKPQEVDISKVVYMADRHKVLPLLYEELCEERKDFALSLADQKRVEDISRIMVKQSYRLLFLTRYLVRMLEEAQIPVLVLKGCGVARLYPVPEMRKSGDVDLLIPAGELAKARELMEKAQFVVKKEQHANHHLACRSGDGIDIELHTMLAEPFSDERINQGMDRLIMDYFEKKAYRDCMGVELPLPAEPYQALQLLLHMLQHFLRAGFGLKLLCDWVVFWNRDMARECIAEFLELADECHVRKFAETITMVCKEFLGLRPDLPMGDKRNRKLAEEFLCDVFAGEEFGEAEKDRMVIVKRNSPDAYLKEFHYQMKMNHPRASRHIVLWPVMWIVTLVVFLRNNRRFHRGSVKDILRNAGDRSQLLQQMGLEESVPEAGILLTDCLRRQGRHDSS